MSDFFISITKAGTKKYPLHQHPKWEIMYYLKGEGYLATQNENIPFKPGSIIIVPPGVTHGSVSQNGFVNISIGGDFSHLFLFDYISVQMDNESRNGERLARLIYDNRYANNVYLSALCGAYAQFLLHNLNPEKRITQAIRNIIEQVSARFSDPCFDVTSLLNQSGYAEDYIRAEFKNSLTISPIDFLTKTRIEHAKKLLEIYGSNLSISEISEACGFDDPIYFSRRFKQFAGISPTEYKKRMLT
jgi:transcriptional regulator GlxA family with amidase domain